MTSAEFLEDGADRDASVAEVREALAAYPSGVYVTERIPQLILGALTE